MKTMLTAKQVDEMLLTQKAAFIDQLLCDKKKELLEKEYGISPRTAARYRRLIHLIPELARMVDESMLPILSGVALSYLEKEEQEIVFEKLITRKAYLIPSVANKLKRMKGGLSKNLVDRIISNCKTIHVRRPNIKLCIQSEVCSKYFTGMNQEEMEKKVEQILNSWFKANAQEERLILTRRLYAHADAIK